MRGCRTRCDADSGPRSISHAVGAQHRPCHDIGPGCRRPLEAVGETRIEAATRHLETRRVRNQSRFGGRARALRRCDGRLFVWISGGGLRAAARHVKNYSVDLSARGRRRADRAATRPAVKPNDLGAELGADTTTRFRPGSARGRKSPHRSRRGDIPFLCPRDTKLARQATCRRDGR